MLAVLTPIMMVAVMPFMFAMANGLKYPYYSDFVETGLLVLWCAAWPLGVLLGVFMSTTVDSTILAVLGYLAGMAVLFVACIWPTYAHYAGQQALHRR